MRRDEKEQSVNHCSQPINHSGSQGCPLGKSGPDL